MNSIYVFLIRNDIWIYILCSLGLVWYLSELWKSHRILRSAMFGLEQERGRRIQRRAISYIAFFALVLGVVAYVNLQIAPTLSPALLRPPTPTPNIFATPLSSPTPLGGPQPDAASTLSVAPTVTLSSQESLPALTEDDESSLTTTVIPTATQFIDLEDCSTETNISAPPDGASAIGSVTFFGTATTQSFSTFDLEALGPETDNQWESITEGGISNPIVDGILWTADLSGWEPGLYIIRLSVFNATDEVTGQCTIQLTLDTLDS
jgi:hypothetical protein